MLRELLTKVGLLRNLIAWLGLVLMITSFVFWQIGFEPAVVRSQRRARVPGPFALVVLDAGHGGQDSGAMCGGVLEKDLTLDIAQRVDRLLQAQGIATL